MERTRNAAPTIQSGLADWDPGVFKLFVISKMAPRHIFPAVSKKPVFMSAGLIGHEGPPKEIVTFNVVLHAV